MQVTAIGHDAILGGHLGVKKTTDKVISDFFWPGFGGDVKRYCRSCNICERTVLFRRRLTWQFCHA